MTLWSTLLASAGAGVLIANALPHAIKGLCGDSFPTPFSRPPGRGLSSPTVNLLWAFANAALGVVLGWVAAHADVPMTTPMITPMIMHGARLHIALAAGALLALAQSYGFSRKHKE